MLLILRRKLSVGLSFERQTLKDEGTNLVEKIASELYTIIVHLAT